MTEGERTCNGSKRLLISVATARMVTTASVLNYLPSNLMARLANVELNFTIWASMAITRMFTFVELEHEANIFHWSHEYLRTSVGERWSARVEPRDHIARILQHCLQCLGSGRIRIRIQAFLRIRIRIRIQTGSNG